MFADEPEHEVLGRKAKILSTMYDWLEYLAGQSYTFGAHFSSNSSCQGASCCRNHLAPERSRPKGIDTTMNSASPSHNFV